MGKSSKKKKKRGHGASARKSKDYASHSGDETDIIMEELTVLEATYQEDLKIVSKSPFVVNLNIRPYSRDTGFDDLDMSAVLSVRYVPGYPNKCPKFHITPGEGLSEEDASRLLLLLQDQAIVNAREGRVMIFNLVEAAKEFLSEIIPQGQSTEFVSNTIVDKKDQLAHQDMETSGDNTHYFRGPFVYGLVDLFIGYKDSLNWDHGTEKIRGGNLSVVGHSLDPLNIGYRPLEKKVLKNGKSLTLKDPKKNSTQPPLVKLDSLREERETDSGSMSNDSNGSDSEDSEEHGFIIEDHEQSTIEDSKDNDSDLEDKPSLPLTSIKYDQESSWAMKKDLIMVHLLRLACASKGPLSDSLQEISSELYRLGIFSEWAKDLAAKPLQFFKEDFVNSFGEHMGLSLNPQFWDSSDLEVSASRSSSRYHNDFEEIASLGHGGFGHVSLCRNKLDGRQYAVKRIPLEDKSLTLNDRILREVATLSRLQHQHVVRFYQAWVETEVGAGYNDLTWGSTASSSGYSLKGSSSTYVAGTDNKQESTFLYIQMEYCPRTLRQVFESYGSVFGKELAWHLFRQIVEGLAHIHAQGIIHRDLTPSNIFFDARNDIKIGDFGLAKFLKLEQLDHEPNPIGTTGNTVDGTGHVGTYFYTAPEIEQEWPKIDEKADMYSLGVVFFELWHPFNTAMERHVVLSDLKNKGSPPTAWVAEYPEQAALLQRLMSPSPSNRPSTTELLQHDLPPRMEDEWLDDVLRAIQSPEDTRVYEKVVQKIFDEERLATKALHQRCIKVNLGKEDSFFSQCTELETEIRDHVEEVAKGAFRQHCAKRLETTLLSLLDESPQFNRNAVKLLTKDGDVLELCHEMRLPFKSSFRRYELSWVYRNSVGHSTPNRYLQGDFDIVGGAVSVTEAEIIKVAMDIVTSFFHSNSCHIRLNHAYLLDAIWCWVGIEAELRESVAQCLSVMGSLCPQSSKRKSSWTLVRRQLLQVAAQIGISP
ncbi:hypothetical protein Scep_010965 [Stephania cephalantha]|uniref:non-specific serine/threonine protein kinase n=1 Tax=Stephania cephalantha TaxID=152367 RepID=A0AAP0JWV7_9MAGN